MASVDSARVFICPQCHQPASATVRGLVVWDGYDAHGESRNPPVEYTLLQCDSCGDASLTIREDYGQGFDADSATFLYPAPRRLNWDVPEPLRREWNEAQACFEAKAYAACLVMVRRTVEGTCRDHGAHKRVLADSLKELRTQGLIDGTLADWADALRLAGNAGAHFTGEPVSREDAEDALGFAEALLDHLYVLRKRFQEFHSRLSERKEGPQEQSLSVGDGVDEDDPI
jgi:hypothetical protein